MSVKKIYPSQKEAKKACKPNEYARKTLPWSHKKGYICVKRAYWMRRRRRSDIWE